MTIRLAALLAPLVLVQEQAAPPGAAAAKPARVDVVLDRTEADAVLAGDVPRLLESDGYRRLKRREASMGRAFADEEFRRFVESPELAARKPSLAATLEKWSACDVAEPARLALDYLPSDARIRCRVFPVVKPQDNTFVFEPATDPAIFFSIDPAMSREKFANTLAHELHHIGYASCCPSKEAAAAIARLSPRAQAAFRWIGAFGEGFAMLAAAGGPDVHPHAASPEEERKRWDRDVARFDADLRTLEGFFFDVVEGRLDATRTETRAMSFFGVQGPWYTVGWRMAVSIEKALGRPRLIECMADPRLLLPAFNDAADQLAESEEPRLATWSEALIEELGR
jgi:hypothetical protein